MCSSLYTRALPSVLLFSLHLFRSDVFYGFIMVLRLVPLLLLTKLAFKVAAAPLAVALPNDAVGQQAFIDVTPGIQVPRCSFPINVVGSCALHGEHDTHRGKREADEPTAFVRSPDGTHRDRRLE